MEREEEKPVQGRNWRPRERLPAAKKCFTEAGQAERSKTKDDIDIDIFMKIKIMLTLKNNNNK